VLREAVEDYCLNENMLVQELVLQMKKAWGFSAGKLASGVEILEQMVKDANVEGAVIYTVRFCDVYLFDVPPLIQTLGELGVPALHLEWDHSMSGFAQLKTRLEAFIEMVSGIV